MTTPDDALRKSELAALDLVIAALEDGTLLPSDLDGSRELRPSLWEAVKQAAANIYFKWAGGAAHAEDDPRLMQASKDLPASISLDDLIALRREVTTSGKQ